MIVVLDTYCRMCVCVCPGDFRCWCDVALLAGNTALVAGDMHLAIEKYSEAIRLAPSGPMSHIYFSNRAAAHTVNGDYELALEDGRYVTAILTSW